MNKTPNFFIERYSYDDKAGGPWQSLEKQVSTYVYFYIKNKTAFVFDVKTLVAKLDEICKNKKLIDVVNQNHTTRGYKIARQELECVLLSKLVY